MCRDGSDLIDKGAAREAAFSPHRSPKTLPPDMSTRNLTIVLLCACAVVLWLLLEAVADWSCCGLTAF
jgi:hypothetical protein